MRSDGQYLFYILQGKHDSGGPWFDYNMDVIMNMDEFYEHGKMKPCLQSFMPSADCWQHTGIKATYNLHDAFELLELLKINNRGKFRIIERYIEQKSSIVETIG